jgi:hypothetical protein
MDGITPAIFFLQWIILRIPFLSPLKNSFRSDVCRGKRAGSLEQRRRHDLNSGFCFTSIYYGSEIFSILIEEGNIST